MKRAFFDFFRREKTEPKEALSYNGRKKELRVGKGVRTTKNSLGQKPPPSSSPKATSAPSQNSRNRKIQEKLHFF